MKLIENLDILGQFLLEQSDKLKSSEFAKELLGDLKYGLNEQLRFVRRNSKTAKFLIRICNNIEKDIECIKEKDPAAKNALEIILTYSGFHAVIAYRISHILYKNELYTLARLVSQAARFFTGIEIHPGAKIGKRLFIDHGMGVVIGETAIIGNDCLIYQGATLGGTGKDKGLRRHPKLGDNVMIGAGSKVLGGFTVGDNAKVAANAVVLKDVPANYTAVGVPAKMIPPATERNDNSTLDHVHIPDPVQCEIDELTAIVNKLCKKEIK